MTQPILLDIIVPTYDNTQQLMDMVNSVRMSTTDVTGRMIRILMVKNGEADFSQLIPADTKGIEILNPGKNLGWEGGLKHGLEHSKAPFVAFMNDDVRFLSGDLDWVYRVLSHFRDPRVGAVGPSSNFVMGQQNIFMNAQGRILSVKYLIGYCMFLRRAALDKAGGVDDRLPGGDDIDLSIRLRDEQYLLLALRDMFVFHHGQQTGPKATGGNWDTQDHQSRTYHALIAKHGMLKFWETIVMGWQEVNPYKFFECSGTDTEGDMCRQYVQGKKIAELGCGAKKTVENSVGFDIVPRGDLIDVGTGEMQSIADVVCDIQEPLPIPPASQDTIIARHVLEHTRDVLKTLRIWNQALKIGGRLIVAVPNDLLGNTILMNPDHKHAFTPDSLKTLTEAAGFATVAFELNINGVSLVLVLKKTGEAIVNQPQKRVELPCLA